MKFRPLASALAIASAVAILQTPSYAQLSSNVTVIASGLEGPRGLKFGPDGYLYVAEAGTGGTTSTVGQCTQVIPPIGPYVSGNTSRISRIDHSGNRITVASGLPSSQNAIGDFQGISDLAFLDGELYASLAGAGCSHGNASVPNAVIRVNAKTGSWKIVANLSRFLQEHQAMYENPPDFEPDGVFYSLIAHLGRLYTVEPNHGQVFSVDPSGDIREEIDISRAEAHIVPTSIAAKDGDFGVITQDSSYPKAIKDAVFALKQGEISAPIKQPSDFYIIRAEEVGQEPYNDVIPQISQAIRLAKYAEWLKGMQAQYNVKIDNPAYFAPRAPAQLQQVH